MKEDLNKVLCFHDLIKKSASFCLMPWVHLHITTTGKVNVCCVSKLTFGDVAENSVQEIWNGDRIKSFRRKMLNNESDKRCSICYNREVNGLESLRQQTNAKFQNKVDWIQQTDEFGNTKNAAPVYLDIRFSNICNFKCRTCWHGSSSSWYEEAVRMKSNSGNLAIIRPKNYNELLIQLNEILPNVEEIFFAGGEPLLMKEHVFILQKFITFKNTKVRLHYNTNFSTLKLEDETFIKYWKAFDNIKIAISLDGQHKQGAYIRKGLNWKAIFSNLKHIKKQCPHIRIVINPTVSIYNISDIPDFHQQWVESGMVAINDFDLNLLQKPDYLNVKILPDDFKPLVVKRYQSHLNWINDYSNRNNIEEKDLRIITSQFESIITYLLSGSYVNLIHQFIAYNKTLDKNRNEDFAILFPTLSKWLDYK